MGYYRNWLQSSVHRLLCFCGEVQEKWQQHRIYLYNMSTPQVVSLWGEFHFVLKERLQKWGFLWAEFTLEVLFPLCQTLLWLELLVIFFCQDFSCIPVYYRYITPGENGLYKGWMSRTLQNQHLCGSTYVEKCVLVVLVQRQWQMDLTSESVEKKSAIMYDLWWTAHCNTILLIQPFCQFSLDIHIIHVGFCCSRRNV